jgi:hypothetical protein
MSPNQSILLAQKDKSVTIIDKKTKTNKTSAEKPGNTILPATGDAVKSGTRKNVLNPNEWYIKLSTQITYLNLGAGVEKIIDQIEGTFKGDTLEPRLLVYEPSFSIKTDRPFTRAGTHIAPMGNVGIGLLFGKHQVELDFGFAGLVPLNSVNLQTKMTLTEKPGCNPNCPLADLGFVDRNTGKGRYKLNAVVNEEIWLITPSLYYDYILKNEKWGRISIGGSLGLMLLSMRQQITYKAKRIGGTDLQGDITDFYTERILEGTAFSTALNQVGPISRLYFAYRKSIMKGIVTEIRAGFNYGWIDFTRDVDGTQNAKLGSSKDDKQSMTASFPIKSMGFKNREESRLEMLGFFVQAGVVF